MICSHCGSQVSDTAKYCRNCGKAFLNNQPEIETAETNNKANTKTTSNNKNEFLKFRGEALLIPIAYFLVGWSVNDKTVMRKAVWYQFLRFFIAGILMTDVTFPDEGVGSFLELVIAIFGLIELILFSIGMIMRLFRFVSEKWNHVVDVATTCPKCGQVRGMQYVGDTIVNEEQIIKKEMKRAFYSNGQIKEWHVTGDPGLDYEAYVPKIKRTIAEKRVCSNCGHEEISYKTKILDIEQVY